MTKIKKMKKRRMVRKMKSKRLQKKRMMSKSRLKKVTNQRKRRTRRKIRSIRRANMVITALTKAITLLKKLSNSNLTWMLENLIIRMSTFKCASLITYMMQNITTTMINSGLIMTHLTITLFMITRQIIVCILLSLKTTLTMMDTMRP